MRFLLRASASAASSAAAPRGVIALLAIGKLGLLCLLEPARASGASKWLPGARPCVSTILAKPPPRDGNFADGGELDRRQLEAKTSAVDCEINNSSRLTLDTFNNSRCN